MIKKVLRRFKNTYGNVDKGEKKKRIVYYVSIGLFLIGVLSMGFHIYIKAANEAAAIGDIHGQESASGSETDYFIDVLETTPQITSKQTTATINETIIDIAESPGGIPEVALSPAPTTMPSPTVTIAPTPTPIDLDELVLFYEVEADRYYNDYGYSSNHYEYTDEELYMLAQVIYGEARGESSKGKIAVGNVVMNRVLVRGHFGDTIEDVITAPGQFTGYSASIKPNSACVSAARKVLDEEFWVIPQDVYFFHSGLTAGENWSSHKYYTSIGVHCFYTENYRGRNRNGLVPPALYERSFKWPRYGCEPGERVYRIQYMLNALGYDVKADRYFGKTTKEALIEFQTKKGIEADGIAGPGTIKALITAYGQADYCAKFL